MSDGDREMMHRLDAQSLKSLHRTDDIEHRVYGSDLVEMDLLGRDTVDTPFGLTNQTERLESAFFHPIGNRRPLDEPEQLPNVTTVRLRGDLELDLLARDTGAPDVSNRNAHIPYPETAG
jgi:hypothetical protein